jgi:drug/metabolite transporter (DMT)-like permease
MARPPAPPRIFYLVPGTVALLAWMLLGEPLTLVAAAGIVLASAGCWLVNAGPGATAGIDG